MEKTVFELFNEMKPLWAEFESNHQVFEEKGNKAAAGRARKAINELKKHVTLYKKASVAAGKK
jgi:hypothetical protein